MENLEKYIREQKGAFDEHKADRAKMWARIEERIETNSPKVIPIWKRPALKIAASIVLLMGVAGIFGLTFFKNNEVYGENYVSQELQDIDNHYRSLVSYQVRLVERNERLSDTEKEEFLSFMDALDKEYEELRSEMKNNLDNQKVLQAIIANYKKRIELIENLLDQLNEPINKDDDYGYTL